MYKEIRISFMFLDRDIIAMRASTILLYVFG